MEEQNKSSAEDVKTENQTDKSAKNQETDSSKTDIQTIPLQRFNEVYERMKKAETRLNKLMKEKEEAEKKALEEKGQFKELYEKTIAEKNALQQSLITQAKREAVLASLYSANVHNPKTVMKLIDLNAISLDDSGAVSGVEEEIQRLKQSDPYLFRTESENEPGTDNATPQKTGGTVDLAKAVEELNPDEFRKLYKQVTGIDLP